MMDKAQIPSNPANLQVMQLKDVTDRQATYSESLLFMIFHASLKISTTYICIRGQAAITKGVFFF